MERRVVPSQGRQDRPPGTGRVEYGLPDEVLAAGQCLVTAVIHTLSAANFWVWDEEQRPRELQWPESSGGLDTLKRIFERHRQQQRREFRWEFPPLEDRRKNYPSAASHSFRLILSCTNCCYRSATANKAR
jgi:hypothetical protein